MIPGNKTPARRRLTDDDLVNLALSRFGKSGLHEIKEIAAQSGRNQAVVIRAIAAAFRKGLVEVRPRSGVGVTRHLEEQLAEQFELLGAHVVDARIPPTVPHDDCDDLTHESIGNGLAEVLSRGPIFDDGSRIGIGSGRAVHSTVASLQQQSRLRAQDITIASLSGNLMPEGNTRTKNIRYDADWNASVLAQAFDVRVELLLMSNNLVAKSTEKAREAHADQWPGSFELNGRKLSHALCGVGVFESGHRLFDAKTEESMGPIQEHLAKLRDLAEVVRSQFTRHYQSSPVADLSNHLFVVRPFPGMIPKELARLIEQIQDEVREINQFFVKAPDRFLREARTLILSAGMARKAQALLHLLEGDESLCRVRYLATDRRTAEWLLQQPHRKVKDK